MINVDKLFQRSAPSIEFELTLDPPVEAETSAEHALWTQDDLNFDSPWLVKGEVFLTESEDLLLIGGVDYELTRSCARCLQDVKLKEHKDLAIAFRDPRKNPMKDQSVELGTFEGLQEWLSLSDLYPSSSIPHSLLRKPEYIRDDYPVYPWIYRDLDIKQALREQILIDQDQRVFCDENCPGLCPTCGLRLDDERCTCEPQAQAQAVTVTPVEELKQDNDDAPVHYPFAGLAALLESEDQEGKQ